LYLGNFPLRSTVTLRLYRPCRSSQSLHSCRPNRVVVDCTSHKMNAWERVNAAYDSQCVNIAQDRFAKITSKTKRLVFIEAKPGD